MKAAAGEAVYDRAAVSGAAVSRAVARHRGVQFLQEVAVGKPLVSPLISQVSSINRCRCPGRSDGKR